MSIDYDRLREMVEKHSPAPWAAIDKNDDGKPRPATSRLMRDADGEYLGIMHHPDAELAALAPDMARELLRLRRELTDLRDLMHTNAGYLRKNGHDIAADWTENHALRLAQIMKGDTE